MQENSGGKQRRTSEQDAQILPLTGAVVEEGLREEAVYQQSEGEQSTRNSQLNRHVPRERLPSKKNNFWKRKELIYSFVAGFILICGLFVFYYSTDQQCMCWNGERYIQVDCKANATMKNVLVLDVNELQHFQKITRQDTLSSADIGKVWYSKINNEVEFFTNHGFHPIHRHKPLKAATAYMIKNYAKN